jgi:hypothetical protein
MSFFKVATTTFLGFLILARLSSIAISPLLPQPAPTIEPASGLSK